MPAYVSEVHSAQELLWHWVRASVKMQKLQSEKQMECKARPNKAIKFSQELSQLSDTRLISTFLRKSI